MTDAEKKCAWARRVNRQWIVHHGLGQRAEEWLRYLAKVDEPRMNLACWMARAMCEHRGDQEDPKPWFYAGLFSVATWDEAQNFLIGYRLTGASVPALANDESMKAWVQTLRPETRTLLERLRAGIHDCLSQAS
jgi:hypothetical protein